MKRQTESLDEFKTRINAAAESEESEHGTTGNDDNWSLGAAQRHKVSFTSGYMAGQQGLLVVVIWLFILHKVGGEPEALCNDLILKLNTVWLYRFMHPKQT
ncbi:hypothetical protein ACKU2E_027360 [Klebsiella pneumoniae]